MTVDVCYFTEQIPYNPQSAAPFTVAEFGANDAQYSKHVILDIIGEQEYIHLI